MYVAKRSARRMGCMSGCGGAPVRRLGDWSDILNTLTETASAGAKVATNVKSVVDSGGGSGQKSSNKQQATTSTGSTGSASNWLQSQSNTTLAISSVAGFDLLLALTR